MSLVSGVHGHLGLRQGLTGGLLLGVLLVAYSLVRYPALAGNSGDTLIYSLMLGLSLLLGMFAVIRGRSPTGAAAAVALREGARFGVILGLLWMVQVLGENLIVGDQVIKPILLGAIELAVLVLMVVAGIAGARQTGRVATGAWVGFWSGLISGLITFLTIMGIAYLFMNILLTNGLNEHDFARNPGIDHATVLITESLAAAVIHFLLIGIVLGTALGALGGIIGRSAGRSGSAT